jgi:hypothetical protein
MIKWFMADTGDVRFVCLEKQKSQPTLSPNRSPSEAATTISRRSSSASSHYLFPAQTTARKRVIYAHSDVLIHRSEYFSTMLASSFAENTSGLAPGERKLYTVVVEEAAYEEVYWLLKWVYANWLLFKEQDDPREAVDGVGAGWSARWLNVRGGEWDWKTFRKISGSEDSGNSGTRDDARSATSGESRLSNLEEASSNGKTKGFQSATTPTSAIRQPSSSRTTSKTSPSSSNIPRQLNSNSSRRSVAGPSAPEMIVGNAQSTSAQSTKPVSIPLSVSVPTYSPSSRYPISPRSQRQHAHPPSIISTPDPHPHPSPPPPPASALSMYQIAHRYAMPGLATLALEHMMSTITPQSSFALLLASSVWDEIRALVEVRVVNALASSD